MKRLFYLLLLIIILPLITVSANENVESEILKEWRILNSKPQLSPGKKISGTSKNSVEMSMFLNKVNKNWNKLSSSTQNLIKPILLRPTDLLYLIPGQQGTNINVVYDPNFGYEYYDTTNFRIYYAKGGKDAPPSLDFVKIIAGAFESSYAIGVTNKGFTPPPDDFNFTTQRSADNNGGDSRYDVYLKDIGTNFIGTFGWTQPEGIPNNQSKDYVRYSFIVMDNDYATAATPYNADPQYDTTQSPENFARITASHEFFHAIQYSYNQNVDDWFLEASAIWFEDQVFPYINDYIRYLKGDFRWFSLPEIPLDFDTTSNTHKYGSGIWPIFLEKKFSGILKNFFEDAGATSAPNVFNILDTRLRAVPNNSSLSSAFSKFTVWNYFTGKNDDGAHYPDGALYDTLYIYNTTSDYMPDPRVTPIGINEKLPGYLGSNYLIFTKSGSNLRIVLNGSEFTPVNLSWNASVIIKSGATYTETTIVLDAQNAGGINITSPYDTVILIPSIYETAHAKSDLTRLPYEYGFSSDTVAPSIISALAASDVPLDQGYTIALKWSASPDDTTGGSIDSYDILRSTSSGTGFSLAASVIPNGSALYSTTNTVPANKTNYYYKIRARDKWYNYNTAGEIESLPVMAIDDKPPGPPTNAKASDTPLDEGGSINVTWNKSADDGNGAFDVAKYTIFRAANLAGPFQTAGVASQGKTIFYDTPVINNTDYWYYVVAEDGNPNYSTSNVTDSAQARDDFTPPPTDFKAVGIDDRISLSWKNPTVPDFVKVFIRRKNESHPVNKTDGTGVYEGIDSTLADNNSITVGQTYYYSAISYDTAGNESSLDDGSRAQAAITLKAFNYPNPTFSGQTTIRYQLENTSGIEATLYIFDIAGELVLKIDNILYNSNNTQPIAGTPVYDYSWDGNNGKGRQVASGVYIFIIEAKDSISKKDRTGKIAVIK
ncbi:MAG: hypothetical protein PHX78_04565 [bacterium]|nr:hypothetical protein [bacterium]